MLFLLKYIKYYEIGQIGVGLRTDLQQIGTNDMEWLICFLRPTSLNQFERTSYFTSQADVLDFGTKTKIKYFYLKDKFRVKIDGMGEKGRMKNELCG